MSQAFQISKFQTNGRINGVKLSLDSTVRDFNMWPLAVLTGDCIDGRRFFCKEMHDRFAGPKKSDRNNEVTGVTEVVVRWASTVVSKIGWRDRK